MLALRHPTHRFPISESCPGYHPKHEHHTHLGGGNWSQIIPDIPCSKRDKQKCEDFSDVRKRIRQWHQNTGSRIFNCFITFTLNVQQLFSTLRDLGQNDKQPACRNGCQHGLVRSAYQMPITNMSQRSHKQRQGSEGGYDAGHNKNQQVRLQTGQLFNAHGSSRRRGQCK